MSSRSGSTRRPPQREGAVTRENSDSSLGPRSCLGERAQSKRKPTHCHPGVQDNGHSHAHSSMEHVLRQMSRSLSALPILMRQESGALAPRQSSPEGLAPPRTHAEACSASASFRTPTRRARASALDCARPWRRKLERHRAHQAAAVTHVQPRDAASEPTCGSLCGDVAAQQQVTAETTTSAAFARVAATRKRMPSRWHSALPETDLRGKKAVCVESSASARHLA